jgi:hypothetical protein
LRNSFWNIALRKPRNVSVRPCALLSAMHTGFSSHFLARTARRCAPSRCRSRKPIRPRAWANHSYAAIAPAATIEVAASVIVTAVLTPMLTAWVYKRAQSSGAVPRDTHVNEEGQVELDRSQGAVNQG